MRGAPARGTGTGGWTRSRLSRRWNACRTWSFPPMPPSCWMAGRWWRGSAHPERQGEEAVFRAAFLESQGARIAWRGYRTAGRRSAGRRRRLYLGCGPLLLLGGVWPALDGEFTRRHRTGVSDNASSALELATDRFYHLDTCFCPLAGGKLLYYPPAFTAEAAGDHRTPCAAGRPHRGDGRRRRRLLCQCRQYRPPYRDGESRRHCLRAQAARAAAISLTEVDLAPFILSGGGAYCMTLRLDRRSDAKAARRGRGMRQS